MYYPYFRGKQYELITIRESASIFAERNFIPIIEPVKEQLNSLRKTLDSICENDAKVIVVINPQLGFHSDNNNDISVLLNNEFADVNNIIRGILLTEEQSIQDAQNLVNHYKGYGELALMHAGFSQAKKLASMISDQQNIDTSIFLENYCGKLYRRHFKSHANKTLIRNGFQQRINRDHPPIEFFSDLHVTFEEELMNGFGDFLIVGDDYSEMGGPAYTVAIHLTFIDHEKDDEMHIHHFKSDRQDTPKDPAGKFAEALDKLITELHKPDNKIHETSAIQEFNSLHSRGHFPGLGYVKKLSMKHHIETLAKYFSERRVAAT
ncbi:MAG: sce7725 family protein [Nitrospinae bacterium]|nr:sce7725 family protein [Nitrospinota bacterium]